MLKHALLPPFSSPSIPTSLPFLTLFFLYISISLFILSLTLVFHVVFSLSLSLSLSLPRPPILSLSFSRFDIHARKVFYRKTTESPLVLGQFNISDIRSVTTNDDIPSNFVRVEARERGKENESKRENKKGD